MGNNIKVSVSILCADFSKLGDEIKRIEDSGVDMIHVDVMDGHFVPNITIGPLVVEAIRPLTKLPIDAHLMIEHPEMYIDKFLEAGADMISLHVENYGPLKKECQAFGQFPKEIERLDSDRAREDIQRVKAHGKKVCMVISPGTPLCVQPLLEEIDGVLIMSVNPGFAKQKFMPKVLTKIQELRTQFQGDIAIDGGVNSLTAPEAVKAGANILATASYYYGSDKPKELVKSLKALGA